MVVVVYQFFNHCQTATLLLLLHFRWEIKSKALLIEAIRDPWVKKITLVPSWTFQWVTSPSKCILHTQVSATHPQVVVWCRPVVPSDACPVVIGREGWQRKVSSQSVWSFLGWKGCLKHFCVYTWERKDCALSVRGEGTAAVGWQGRGGRLRGGSVRGGSSASPVVLPCRPRKIFSYPSKLQQPAAAECPGSPLSEQILMTASAHLFKHFWGT